MGDLVDDLYAAFAHTTPGRLAGCPCCVDDAHRAALMRDPLRQTRPENLSRFAFKAMSTWGTADDFQAFLPRILELTLSSAGRAWPGFDLDIVVAKMLKAGWADWPEGRRRPVRALIDQYWRDGVERGDPGERVLDALGLLDDCTDARLAWWAGALDRRGPLSALAVAMVDDWNRLVADAPTRIALWLTEPDRHVALEDAFARYIDDPIAETIAEAIDAWNWAHDTRRRVLMARGRRR